MPASIPQCLGPTSKAPVLLAVPPFPVSLLTENCAPQLSPMGMCYEADLVTAFGIQVLDGYLPRPKSLDYLLGCEKSV